MMLRKLEGFVALETGDRVSTELRQLQASQWKAGRLSGATPQGGILLHLGSREQASLSNSDGEAAAQGPS